ncbi:class I SAM-dependent methyltransferase [Actinomadura flavalba]|uniref:class I SAM-dependent methyltransferase n=1 Tax=Actinomadura flavalba TaxID=1120938 RepID=UPI0003630796|nr:class I SAM-dependent methyltransferase [Actinomadura flavalba]
MNEISARATADAYDAVAALYAGLPRDDLERTPLDRAVLGAFAEAVGRGGLVCEAGCGPGPVVAHLRGLGLDAFGVDLAAGMIGIARAAYPGVRFDVGSMDALDVADGALRGVVSWYSVIHASPADMPGYLAEFRRVLADGGHLLLAFFEAEDGPLTTFDHRVATAYRWPVDDLAETARNAGFAEVGRMLREPGDGERFRRGHLLMRAVRPEPAGVAGRGVSGR